MVERKEVIKASKISQINVEEILIGTKKMNKKVSIRYHEKPLVIQTPFLEIMGPLKKTIHPNIYQMETLFSGDTKNRIREWYEFIENIENNISTQVINNGTKWFTSKNIEIKSLIREHDVQPGTFFIRWLIKLETNIFVDDTKKQFNPFDLKAKDLVKLIAEIPDIWINENQCGLAVLVQKVMVMSLQEKTQNEYVFSETDSDETDETDKDNNIITLLATEQKVKNNVPQPSVTKSKSIETIDSKNSKQFSKQQNPQAEKIKKLMENVKGMSGKRNMNRDQTLTKNNQKLSNKLISDLSEDEEISIEEIPENKQLPKLGQYNSSSEGINEEDLDFN